MDSRALPPRPPDAPAGLRQLLTIPVPNRAIGEARERTGMTTLVPFPIEKARRSASGEKGPDAMIIIFPGVRIERMDFSLADRLPTRGNRRTSQAQKFDYDSL